MKGFDKDRVYMCSSPFRVNDELKHNPYVGSFHGVQRPSEEQKDISIARHNPHLGIIRHSPAVCTLPLKLNMGFKGLLSDEPPMWKTSVMSHLQVAAYKSSSELFSTPIETNFQLHLTERLINRIPTAIFSYPQYHINGSMSNMTNDNILDIENSLEHILPTCTPLKTSLRNNYSKNEWLHIPFMESDGQIPSCAICLESFADGCEIRKLACNHCYHKKCIDIWLMGEHSHESIRTTICPTCRQDAVPSSSQGSPLKTTSNPSNPRTLGALLIDDAENEKEDGEVCSESLIMTGCLENSIIKIETEIVNTIEIEPEPEPASKLMDLSIETCEHQTDMKMNGSSSSQNVLPKDLEEAVVLTPLDKGKEIAPNAVAIPAKFPDSAFTNVGQFLMSGFGYITKNKTSTSTKHVEDTQTQDMIPMDIGDADISAGCSSNNGSETIDVNITTNTNTISIDNSNTNIEDQEDFSVESCLLESTYSLCGIPLSIISENDVDMSISATDAPSVNNNKETLRV